MKFDSGGDGSRAGERLLRSGIPIRLRSTTWRPTGHCGPMTGGAPMAISSGRRALPGRAEHPGRRLRHFAGGPARAALAAGEGGRDRCQCVEHREQRTPEAQVRPGQSRAAPAAGGARSRSGAQLRAHRLHRRAAPSAGSRRGAAGPARGAGAGRRDAADGLCALRPGRDLPAAGLLPAARHRRDGARDPGARAEPPGDPARSSADARCCATRRTSATRRRWPMRFFIPATGPIPCRSCWHFLEAGGFRFGRWIEQAAYLPQCGVLASTPHQPCWPDSRPPEQYAAVELFRGSMIRHSAVLYRDDRPPHAPIDFEGDAWLDYVPIRVPDTITVHERLPPGAAAVLINRHHTYTDLYLPINPRQNDGSSTPSTGRGPSARSRPATRFARSRASCSRGCGGMTRWFRRIARPAIVRSDRAQAGAAAHAAACADGATPASRPQLRQFGILELRRLHASEGPGLIGKPVGRIRQRIATFEAKRDRRQRPEQERTPQPRPALRIGLHARGAREQQGHQVHLGLLWLAARAALGHARMHRFQRRCCDGAAPHIGQPPGLQFDRREHRARLIPEADEGQPGQLRMEGVLKQIEPPGVEPERAADRLGEEGHLQFEAGAEQKAVEVLGTPVAEADPRAFDPVEPGTHLDAALGHQRKKMLAQCQARLEDAVGGLRRTELLRAAGPGQHHFLSISPNSPRGSDSSASAWKRVNTRWSEGTPAASFGST